jgi:hypothetical protein
MMRFVLAQLLLAQLWFAWGSPGFAAVVTVEPNTFPALLDCDANSLNVDRLCPRYERIVITLQMAEGEVLPKGQEFVLSLGWPYDGRYLTEPQYTRLHGWPRLQMHAVAEPNFVRLDIEGRPPPTFEVIDQVGRLRFSFDSDLTSSNVLRITLGDGIWGSPGYLLPAMAGETDVVLLRGSEAEGYEPLTDPLPKLRTVGTRVDGFRVLAPSIAQGPFELVIQALEGVEGPMSDRALVPSYAGTVFLSSSDPKALVPESYTFEVADEGVARVPVTLSGGLQTVTVEAPGVQAESSNPVLVRGPVRALGKAALVRRKRNLYWGVLQQHTAVGGHGTQSPRFAYEYARNVARLDFLALTEHCSTTAYRPDYSFGVAREFDEPGRFVTFEAFEWSSIQQGHRHVLFRDGRHQPNLCDRDVGVNPTVVLTPTLDDLRTALTGVDALVVLHHTAWHQPSEAGVVVDVQLGDPSWSQQGLFEVFSHHGSSECANNAPYVIHDDPLDQWPAEKRVFLRDVLEQGFRVGVVAGTDDHFGMPGSQMDGSQSYSRKGITAVYADELTRDSLWEALLARRTYGTTGARILLGFWLDGREMGEEYSSSSVLHGRVVVAGTDTIDRVEVFRDGHTLTGVFPGTAATDTFQFTEPAVPGGETRSYYVRVTQADGHLAWSSPIWVEGEKLAPTDTALTSVMPNPSNPSSTVHYSVATPGHVSIVVYDIAGRHVRILVDAIQSAGPHWTSWNGRDDAGRAVASGVYLVRMRAGDVQSTKKIALLE